MQIIPNNIFQIVNVYMYSKLLSLVCHQNVVSHASNLVTHLVVLLLLNIDILLFSNVSKHCSSAWGGGHSLISEKMRSCLNRLFYVSSLNVLRVLWPFIHFCKTFIIFSHIR